ncbi:unnamed protein product [Rotaria sp. Silwood1]|nr:unnamed protein product [Rotaria sp. Silwood1]
MEWQLDDLSIIKDIIKKLVSKVCRLDHERKRQLQIRKDKKRSWNSHSNETSTSKIYYRNKYHNNNDFRDKEKARTNSRILVKYHTNSNFREKMKSQSKIHCCHKYHKDKVFRGKVKEQSKIHILNRYHNNSDFRNQY